MDNALAALDGGGVVAYPTETVYGLGVDAACEAALVRLLELKGRQSGKGLSLLVAGLGGVAELVRGQVPAAAVRLAAAFWPGPVTIVLPAADSLSPRLVGATGGVGLRCSADPVAAELVSRLGRPLTSTSANPAGGQAATTVAESREYFGSGVDFYLDGGSRGRGDASSVVEFLDDRAYLRREGGLGRERLAAVVSLEG